VCSYGRMRGRLGRNGSNALCNAVPTNPAGEVFLSGSSPGVGTAVVRAVVDHLTGFKVLGVTRAEAALPVGTPVTAVGELALVPEAVVAVPGAVRSRGHVRVPPCKRGM